MNVGNFFSRNASENRRENNGAIPVLNQVMSATRGATDAVSGIGAHVNSSLRRLGMKGIEAGVGCGLGVGHGFGVGVALKPGVMNHIQSCVGQMMVKMMKNLGGIPGFSVGHNLIPRPTQIGSKFVDETFKRNEISSGDIHQIASKVSESRSHSLVGERRILPQTSFDSRYEKIINNFLNSPLLQDEKAMEVNELASKLQTENNVLQMLLKHQKIIDELTEENEKLRQILIKEFNVSPEKFKTSSDERWKLDTTCADCFECRRRRRKSRR
ncbi:uncharacterized protein LOC116266022 isoform X2 [Nymphaea colorata]|uniref:uncharacterized protein LOC116266022 isoform X2 n=1 Tax=Nymphaea colorata TaxID=210225 RepID=UPI00129E8273|nr:uncharacterized protein LOC116266022 isoform X2 [Nymphaea colorata]XP_031502936.1 uncharacterized protein LOC116266022 isoform X2 [Nymphaea colorata]XP_031502937.1 uncharacterized protein LOC116266022 isoform X2 [Nymphaea colorata]